MSKDIFKKYQDKIILNWWNSIGIELKQKYKSHYENVRKIEFGRYPNMIFTENTRISKLTLNQIKSIWRFKEYKK